MRTPVNAQQKLQRVWLIARALVAREAAKEAWELARHDRSARARAAAAAARERLAVLNRAVAVLALQSSGEIVTRVG